MEVGIPEPCSLTLTQLKFSDAHPEFTKSLTVLSLLLASKSALVQTIHVDITPGHSTNHFVPTSTRSRD